MACIQPVTVVSERGEYLGIDGWEDLEGRIKWILRTGPEPMDEGTIERSLEARRLPLARKQTVQSLAWDWCEWVGYWCDLEIQEGDSVQVWRQMVVDSDESVPVEFTIQHLRPDAKRGMGHRLRAHASISLPESVGVAHELANMLLFSSAKQGVPFAEVKERIVDWIVDLRITVETDPATLMPMSVTTTKSIEVVGWKDFWQDYAKEEERESLLRAWEDRTETSRYTFTWQ